jgi:hypothetical protein
VTVPCVWHMLGVGRGHCRLYGRLGPTALVVGDIAAPLGPSYLIRQTDSRFGSLYVVVGAAGLEGETQVSAKEQLGQGIPVWCWSLSAETREQIHNTLLEFNGAGGERLRVEFYEPIEHLYLPVVSVGGRPAFDGA